MLIFSPATSARCQSLFKLPSLTNPFPSHPHHHSHWIAAPKKTLLLCNNPFRSSPPPQRRRHLSTAAVVATSQHSMDASLLETLDRIHSTPFKLVLYVTGGAAQAPAWLLSTPGASRTVLECRVPYSTTALTQVLGGVTPESSVSASTAVSMAKAAYKQAAVLSPFGTPIIGAAATCALSTDRDRRGENRAFVSVYTGTTTRTYTMTLAKGGRGRLEEDGLASRLMIDAIAAAMGASDLSVESRFASEGLLGPGDSLQTSAAATTSPLVDRTQLLKDMLKGRFKSLEFSGSGGLAVVDAARPGRVYLPGSFNPLHEGHKELLAAACRVQGVPPSAGAFELSVGNADKGLLPLPELERRVAQFISAQLPVVITQTPLFTQKADLFPGSTFVVGYDTAARLVQERYYGSETAMLLQFARLTHQKCNFLVAGREEGGTFLALENLEIPEVLQRGALFRGIPESEFRADISSTELREKGQGLDKK